MWLQIALALLPTLIQGVEFIFGAKTGEQKKAAVVNSVNSLVAGISAVSTGGQAKTMQTIQAVISKPITADGKDLIDVIAGDLFPSGSTIDQISPVKTGQV